MSNEGVFWVAATYSGDALKHLHRHKAQGVFELLRQALQDQLRNGGMLHEQIGKLPNRTMTLYYHFLTTLDRKIVLHWTEMIVGHLHPIMEQ